MSEQTTTTPAPETPADALPERVRLACDVAAGRTPPAADARGHRVRAAAKDLNCKGRGPWWYRMRLAPQGKGGGAWQYFSAERLPSGTFRAAERRATVHGDVFAGDLVCSHDRGGPMDPTIYLVCDPDEAGRVLVECEGWAARRDGRIDVTLPDGTVVTVPAARSR